MILSPQPGDPPPPEDRGSLASRWLQAHGVASYPGVIRASSLSTARTCEFLYYLRHRLRIRGSLFDSDALSLGSYVHAFLEDMLLPSPNPAPERLLTSRVNTIEELAIEFRAASDQLEASIARETSRLELSRAWFEAAWALRPIPPTYKPLITEGYVHVRPTTSKVEPFFPAEYFNRRNKGRSAYSVQFDSILYDEQRGEVWILDAKTTSGSPNLRSRCCPFDFQTLLYRAVAMRLLQMGLLQQRLSLPASTKFGGFMHWIMRKPTIRPLKRTIAAEGPVAANAEYADRVRAWYNASGEFDKLAAEWEADPPVNISYVRWPASYPLITQELAHSILYADDLARRYAHPCNFPRNAAYLHFCRTESRFGAALPTLAPFYIEKPSRWPGLIETNFFVEKPSLPLDPLLVL